jgi:hypothetical protein
MRHDWARSLESITNGHGPRVWDGDMDMIMLRYTTAISSLSVFIYDEMEEIDKD